MTHGLCGADNPAAPCMVCKTPNSLLVCSKGFPKQFSANTVIHEDGYLEYQRRDDRKTFAVPKPRFPNEQVVRDNRWVVPYNLYLLQKYCLYINVEICATVKAVKYIYKYIYKGADCTTLAIETMQDEVTYYV